jgi:pentatricopeptide repeat protein
MLCSIRNSISVSALFRWKRVVASYKGTNGTVTLAFGVPVTRPLEFQSRWQTEAGLLKLRKDVSNAGCKAHATSPNIAVKISSKAKASHNVVLRLKKLSSSDREQLFEKLRSEGKADVYHYSTMIGLSASSTEAEKIFAAMRSDGIQPTIVTYNAILRKMMNDGRLSSAERVFKELISKHAPDQFTFCILINGFSKHGKHARAEQLYDQMKAQIEDLDSASYHTVISMFCRSKKHDKAENVLSDMRSRGIQPTAAAYTILISGYGKIAQPEDSLRIYSNLEECGVELDSTVHNAIIHALAVNGKISEAEEIARKSASRLQSTGNENLDGMSEFAMGCNSTSSVSGVELLARQLSHFRVPRALPAPTAGMLNQTVQARDAQDVDIATVTALINAYGRCQRVEDAQALFECLGRLQIKPGISAYNALISSCSHNGDFDLAEHYYVEMVESGLSPDFHTMRALIDGSEAAGDSLAAMDWLSEAARRGVTPFSSFVQWEEGSDGRRALVVDLHSMSALSSTVAVRYVLTSRRLDPRETELVIVTGKGRHSPAGPVVGPAVARFLEQEGFHYSHADGNAGRLVLRRVPGGSATVGLCAVLVLLMWAGGMLLAGAWAETFRRRTAEANRLLALAQMRAELRRGLTQHARRNREQRGPRDPA